MREISLGTYKKYIGSYIGEADNPDCKQNRNIIITKEPTNDFSDIIYYESNEVYTRRTPMKNSDGTIAGYHEVGEKKIKKCLRKVWKKEYLWRGKEPSIQKVWADVPEYPTVSYCMTKANRNAFIVDVDEKFSDIKEAEAYISFNKGLLPNPSYLIRNPSSGHIQFGWFIKEIKEKDFDVFNKVIKRLAEIFHSDACFNGPACKNPYYKGFDTIIYSCDLVDTVDFVKKLTHNSIYNNLSSSSSFDNTNVTTVTKKLSSKKSVRKERKEQSVKESRNYYIMTYLRESIWQYMRSHNDNKPEADWILNRAQQLNREAAEYTGKHQLLDVSEVDNIIKSVTVWSIKHYKDGYNEQGKDASLSDKAREVSILVRNAHKFIKYVDVICSNKNTYSLSRMTISRYKNMKKEAVEQMYYSVIEFLKYARGLQRSNITESFSSDDLWTDLCNDLDVAVSYFKAYFKANISIYNNLSSSFFFDNTNVTTVTVNIEEKQYSTPQSIQDEKNEILKEKLSWEEFRFNITVREVLHQRPRYNQYCAYIRGEILTDLYKETA